MVPELHAATEFAIASCTKSFTSLAYGVLFEDSCEGRLASGRRITLDSPAYDFLPKGIRCPIRGKSGSPSAIC